MGGRGNATATVSLQNRSTDPDAAHEFTQVLSRDHVHVGKDSCADCEELVRRHPVTERSPASTSAGESRYETLKALAEGDPARRQGRLAGVRSGNAPGRAGKDAPPPPENEGSAQSANRWHTAADWCEGVQRRIRQPLRLNCVSEKRRRGQRDAATKAGNEPSTLPMVLLLDDIPVNAGKQRDWFTCSSPHSWNGSRTRATDGATTSRAHFVRCGCARLPVKRPPRLETAVDLCSASAPTRHILADAGTGSPARLWALYGNSGTVLMPSLCSTLRRAVGDGLSRGRPAPGPAGTAKAPVVLLPGVLRAPTRPPAARQILDMGVGLDGLVGQVETL